MAVELISEIHQAWMGFGIVIGMIITYIIVAFCTDLYTSINKKRKDLYTSINKKRKAMLELLKNKDDVAIMKAYWEL